MTDETEARPLEHLTDEDILEEVLANNRRYKSEPNFSKTGVGSLSSASIEERAKEEARSGISSETADTCSQEWEALRSQILTLGETLDCLRGFHRKTPFLFFNGNKSELIALPESLLRA